jgi:predicted anti-sigma-YlaC factor YlaD
MNCRYIESRLSCYVDGELTGREMLLIREHLAGCTECDRQVQQYARLKQLLGSLVVPEVRPGFEDELIGLVLRGDQRQLSVWDRFCEAARANILSWSVGFAGVAVAVMIWVTPEQQGLFTKGTDSAVPFGAFHGPSAGPIIDVRNQDQMDYIQRDYGSYTDSPFTIPTPVSPDSHDLGR